MTPEQFLAAQATQPVVTLKAPRLTVKLADILSLESAIRSSGRAITLPVMHHFSPNVYARELKIPAGAVLTGHTHRFENLNLLTEGEISVVIDGHITRLRAPATLVSPAGTKRVAYAHTRCTWVTVLGTCLRDVAAIEAEFLEPPAAVCLDGDVIEGGC
jgi:quercetin dioxygenase-like cupin family protein